MRRLIILFIVAAFCLVASATRGKDGLRLRKPIACDTRSGTNLTSGIVPRKDWDPNRTYRLPVVLIAFKDQAFQTKNPVEFYDSLFNVNGFNQGRGVGCVADYFRDQSEGLFNLKFDIFGPVEVNESHKMDSDSNYGKSAFRKAVNTLLNEMDNPEYDWDGNGVVETVIVIFAGIGGNEAAEESTGCVWPNTGTVYVGNPKGLDVSDYSASCERWTIGTLCGIGTICHEFSHCLGLPDLYPVTSSDDADYSVLDEWDLMDGGNYSDNGWCPPNYSLHEKEYMGWATPTELTATTTISDMKPMSEGGVGYRIRPDLKGSADEYYLLENRQHRGWDFCLPGHGLLVTHIDFSASVWRGNTVNSYKNHYRLSYLNADNHDYPLDESLTPVLQRYRENKRSCYLAGTAYPYVSDTLVNRQLSDTSVPAATLFNINRNGQKLLGKAIMDIQESDEGFISFFFANSNDDVGLPGISPEVSGETTLYDLQGRKVGSRPLRPGLYIQDRRKVIIQK